MQGWTPKTKFLLRHPSAQSLSSYYRIDDDDDDSGGDDDSAKLSCSNSDQRHHYHGGYDIIDHAFGHKFPLSELLNELQTNGWIDDPVRGTMGKLKPARTKMDVDMGNLLQSFITNPFIADGDDDDDDDALTLSKGNNGTRGDESAFVPRNERMKDSFPKRYPLLHNLVSTIENTACYHFGKTISANNNNGCEKSNDSNAHYFEFDNTLTSVQIAKYPGDGQAGYPRHCDRGATCVNEPRYHHHKQQSSSIENNPPAAERLLTFVYYMTPSEWDAELDGGALRMYSPIMEQKKDEKNNNDNDNKDYDSHYFDVIPYADRLVVFRSDLMEHQVMPSLRRDRMAITVWLYGRVVCRGLYLGISGGLDNATTSENNRADNNNHGNSNRLPPSLPISKHETPTTATASEESAGDETIFVAIPSYRDGELWPTIRSLVETACHPKRIYVGVVFQVDTRSPEEVHSFTTAEGSGVSLEFLEWSQESNFRSILLDYRHATGPCFARHLCQTLHRDEDFVLQIDSHMRFRPNWDTYLIQQLSQTGCPNKSLLTTYPPGYEPTNEPGPDAETRATILVPWKFGKEDGMLRQKGRLLRPEYRNGTDNDNIPCLLYAGGFNFFRSSLLDVCPYDSKLHGLFFGEEISMAVRLYTHGVDLYAPPQTVCYHLWKRNQFRVRDDDGGSGNARQRENSLGAVRIQLRGTGRGLGTVRSVEQFQKELGVDFKKQILSPGCENASLADEAFVSSTSLGLDVEDKSDATETLTSNDMSSVFKLVGQFLNEY